MESSLIFPSEIIAHVQSYVMNPYISIRYDLHEFNGFINDHSFQSIISQHFLICILFYKLSAYTNNKKYDIINKQLNILKMDLNKPDTIENINYFKELIGNNEELCLNQHQCITYSDSAIKIKDNFSKDIIILPTSKKKMLEILNEMERWIIKHMD